MKFCTTHWTELKSGIIERGLYNFVSRTHAETNERAKDLARNCPTKENYDPLIIAQREVFSYADEYSHDFAVIADNCPLCELNKYAEEIGYYAKDWIQLACDDALAHAFDLELIYQQ